MRIIKMPGFDVILFSHLSMLLGINVENLNHVNDPTKQIRILEVGFIIGKLRIKI